jgi:hypothetical protein
MLPSFRGDAQHRTRNLDQQTTSGFRVHARSRVPRNDELLYNRLIAVTSFPAALIRAIACCVFSTTVAM